jgi:hypothetical protein
LTSKRRASSTAFRGVEDRLVTIRRDLLGEGGGSCLQLVRFFNDDEGEDEEEVSPPDAPLQKLAGQHQLLGWHLDADSLNFLSRIGAETDADEYGEPLERGDRSVSGQSRTLAQATLLSPHAKPEHGSRLRSHRCCRR